MDWAFSIDRSDLSIDSQILVRGQRNEFGDQKERDSYKVDELHSVPSIVMSPTLTQYAI